MNNNNIEKYFEELACKHRLIAHSETRKRFFRLELEDILLDKLKTVAYYPFIALERIDFKFIGTPGQKGKRKTIAFDIVDKAENQLPEKINAAYDRLEAIADDIITRIYSDTAKLAEPFESFEWNSIDAAQIPYNDATRLIGIRVVFDVIVPFSCDVNLNNWY